MSQYQLHWGLGIRIWIPRRFGVRTKKGLSIQTETPVRIPRPKVVKNSKMAFYQVLGKLETRRSLNCFDLSKYSTTFINILFRHVFNPFSETEALFVYRGPCCMGARYPNKFGWNLFVLWITYGRVSVSDQFGYLNPSVYLVSKITTSITMFTLLDIGGSLHGVVDSKSADA